MWIHCNFSQDEVKLKQLMLLTAADRDGEASNDYSRLLRKIRKQLSLDSGNEASSEDSNDSLQVNRKGESSSTSSTCGMYT